MRKMFTSLAVLTLSAIVSQASFAAQGKSVIIINNNQTPITVTYSSCDAQGTFCEFTKTQKLGVGEKLLVK